MPATDLPLLIDAARAAGDIAMSHFGAEPETWTKDDDSPVSAADMEVNDALHATLTHARQSYGWLSEESPPDHSRLGRQHCFILDPIDGTRSYLRGESTWAISLAVVTGSQPSAAVIHLPALGLTYTAAAGQGACLNGAPIRCTTRVEADGARLIATKPTHHAAHWTDRPDFERVFRSSLAYRMACVADGKADAMLTLRDAWEWDIAAGALIAAEAGAQVTDRTGAPLRFNTATALLPGTLAANPALSTAIRARLA